MERRSRLRAWLVAQLRAALGRGGYRTDDLLDAIAALWSTIGYANRTHRSFSDKPELDEQQLRMQIIG